LNIVVELRENWPDSKDDLEISPNVATTSAIPSQQCAAVRTQLLWTILPPHKNPDPPPTVSVRNKRVIQGQEPSSAFTPPTIFESRSRFFLPPVGKLESDTHVDKPDLIASLSGANSVTGSVVSGRVEVVVLVVVVVVDVVVGGSGVDDVVAVEVVVVVVVVVVVAVVVVVVVVPGSVQTSAAKF